MTGDDDGQVIDGHNDVLLEDHEPTSLAKAVLELASLGIPEPLSHPGDDSSETEEPHRDPGGSDSDPGVLDSSPIRGGTKAERIVARRRKGQKKKQQTEALKKERRARAEAERARSQQREALRQQAIALQRLQDICLAALDILSSGGVTLGDFLLFVLDPDIKLNGLAEKRYAELLHPHRYISQILHFWTRSASTPPTVRKRVRTWMIEFVSSLVSLEARTTTRRGVLRLYAREVTVDTVLAFDITSVYATLERHTPVMLQISETFATSRRQSQTPDNAQLMRRKHLVVAQSMSSLLREHSRLNNVVANHNSLYLYASGAQRQTITMLSHLGIASSYMTLVRKPRPIANGSQALAALAGASTAETGRPIADGSQDVAAAAGASTPETERLKPVGLLPALSESCMQQARELAATHEYADTYDNLNILDPVAEQILGRKDALESGTATALTKLFSVKPGALSADAAKAAFQAAKPLKITDIIHTQREAGDWRELNIETICWVAIRYGGNELTRFEANLMGARKRDPHEIPVHQTEIFPLQTMEIDEASIIGNVDVVNAIHEQLGLDPDSPEFLASVRLFFGDQLTVARQRAIIAARAGHERDGESWSWAEPIAGLFHTDMAVTTCSMNTHWGKPESGVKNPGSLWSHNAVLDRKPIVLTSLPPYRVCRDLVHVSLYARVLHCLLHVSGTADLSEFSRTTTSFRQLRAFAERVFDTYASAQTVSDLRMDRSCGEEGPIGDDVFENACLFMRDALGLRTFTLLVKSGRSGHLILALKWLILQFKAGGHPKYAREMMHIVHNLQEVWPKPLRDLILQNWLVNPTGTTDGFVALDLMQEHLNFWIKKIYAAHGSNASWDWLKTISPCIGALRKLANQVHAILGHYQGRKHQSPSIERDIATLMKNLTLHHVYELQLGRRIEGGDSVADLQMSGAIQMMHGENATLREYNEEFKTLQQRAKVKPLQPFVAASHEAAVAPAEVEPRDTAPTVDVALPVNETARSETSSSTSSDEFDVDSDLDELFLSLNDEGDVTLDPDADWEEEEGESGDEGADFDDGVD